MADVRHLGVFAQTSRYAAAVRKLLSLKGEGPGVDFGVHLEEERPEHSFIKGERRWQQYNEIVSAAGSLALQRIVNPANSGVLVVVTSAHVTFAAAPTIFNVGLVFPAATAGGAMWLTDTRWSGTALGSTALSVAQASAVSGLNAIIDSMSVLVAEDVKDIVSREARTPPVVLAPGTAFQINAAAVGVNTMRVMVAGYERSLESGELIP